MSNIFSTIQKIIAWILLIAILYGISWVIIHDIGFFMVTAIIIVPLILLFLLFWINHTISGD